MEITKGKTAWLGLAISSGACAAFNGVFAKLTTTKLTTSWSHAISGALGLGDSNKLVEYAIRGMFFGLNLLFNAIMWALFTRALTLATSTVRVSVINTSANFMLTALLGAAIFRESLPGLWWLGAAMLVAGSVIIGRREQAEKSGDGGTAGAEPLLGPGTEFRDDLGEDAALPCAAEPGSRADDARSSVELRTVDQDDDNK
ncbi:hypothetical protein BDY21DRAFT_384804 [Lineolata rhizophorae]|uniref:EamA domain-containing protein n=1 Tax=Lineolata rhizophorae TaxID=578093 RepID=A0A6A6P4Z8_9PEZI|nr:hypothetical protein BDY21DRAFT_384804 [Lineolata rhizophorae]